MSYPGEAPPPVRPEDGGDPPSGAYPQRDYLQLPPQPDYARAAVGEGQQHWSLDPKTGQWVAGDMRQDYAGGRMDVPIERVRRRPGSAGGLAALGVILLKYGAFIFKAKFLLVMLVNIGAYALLFGSRFGWAWGVGFGVGFVALIFIHEMGHVIAAEIEHVPVSPPLFIPFMGAAIFLQQNPRDARSEAVIAIGGPITGTLGAMAAFGLGNSIGLDSKLGLFLVVLSGYGFFINLFNMIPARPLDGGRILGAVSKWFNLIGFGALVGAVALGILPQASFVIWIIILVTGWSTYQRFTRPPAPGYFDISPTSRAMIGLGYLALLGVLVFSYAQTEALLTNTAL